MGKSNESGLKTFIKGSAVLFISNIIIKGIQFFLLPLYTNELTPEMLGVSDAVTTMTGFVFPVLVMGLDSAFSAFYFEEEQNQQDKVFSSITLLLGIMGLLPVAACLFSGQISEMLFRTPGNSYVVLIALLSVTANLLYLPLSLEARLQNKMFAYSVVAVVSSAAIVIFNVLFLSWFHLGIYALILSTLIVNLLQIVLFAFAVKKKFSVKFVDRILIKRMMRYSLPMLPSVLSTLILTLSDRYIILYFHGEQAVGIYGIGSRFVAILSVIISAVSTAYTTFAYSSYKKPEAKEQFSVVLSIVYVLMIGIAFIISIFSKEIISIMAAPEYIGAYKALPDMMFAQVLYTLYTLTCYGVLFEKKSGYILFSTMTAAGVNLALNMLFIPQYGIVAAAFTTLIGYAIMLFINFYNAQRFYPCPYGMKKIMLHFLGLYFVVRILSEQSFVLKLGVTLLCAAVTLFLYRKKIFMGVKMFRG